MELEKKPEGALRVVAIGDVIGEVGRQLVRHNVSKLRQKYDAQFVVVNGENSAGAMGITKTIALEFFSSGVDVITTGNHIWAKREILDYIDSEPRLLRPLNFPEGCPGRGSVILYADNVKVGVVNLIGRIFMEPVDCPFVVGRKEVEQIRKITPIVIVDFHAEATSEKQLMGWHLDGLASLVFGTHTHVPTADERILPNGTAFITDVGMTGAGNSVIGMDINTAYKRIVKKLPQRIEPAKENPRMDMVIVDIDINTGKALKIYRRSVGFL